jgi:hypothetical protein
MPALNIGFYLVGPVYAISFTGFLQVLNLAKIDSIFLGDDRHFLLKHVTDAVVQIHDGNSVLIITMNKS